MKRAYLIMLLLACLLPVFGQWQIDEDFEGISTLPPGWSFHDDGDGLSWRNLDNASHAHSGSRAAFCDNYFPNQNSDWLITPQIQVTAGDSLMFWTRSWISTEPLQVWVSTSGTAIGNFSTLLGDFAAIGTAYQEIRLSLAPWTGQAIYLGFLWECENYGILIDDLKVGQPQIIQPVLDLPDSVTFIQGESLSLDFTPYITTTALNTASITSTGAVHVLVDITGLNVEFSCPDWNGSEDITFTLHDGTSGLSDDDVLNVTVLPPPAVDLAVTEVHSPMEIQFLGLPFTPRVTVSNSGDSSFNDILELSASVRDAQNNSIWTSQAFQPATIAQNASVDVLFSQPCTIAAEGDYSITFEIANTDGNLANNILTQAFSVVLRVTQGGPDAFGYSFIDSNAPGGPVYDWQDISATGASSIMHQVPSFAGDDNFSEPIPLGFAFPFYGYQYTEAYVDINGELLLEPNTWYNPYPGQNWDNDGNMFNYMYPIPGYAQMPGLIAVYWDDLLAEQGVSDIYFETFGSAPDRYTIIQWHNLRFYAGTGGSPILKFQVILYENGEIVMQYHTTHTGQIPGTVPHANGLSATVAIQNASADIGLPYLREIVQNNNYVGVEPAGNLLHDGLALRFFNAADTQPPVFSHDQPGNTFNQNPVLTANVIDFSAISACNLHYNYGSGWQSLAATSVQGAFYSFDLPEIPLGSELRYYFSAADELNNSGTLPSGAPGESFSFKILPSASATVLLAISGNQDYQRTELPFYTQQFDALDFDYDIYDWEEYPSWSIPDQYQAVFIYATTGSQGSRADSLSVALMNWLEGGTISAPRNVFMASDGWAFNTHAHPNDSVMRKMLNAYFRAHYVATGVGGGTNGLAGPDVFTYQNGTILRRTNSPIGMPNTEYDVYANSPDCIFYYDECPDAYADQVQYPEIGAVAAFTFEDGPVGGHAYLQNGVCATALELPIYRAFYFSFDLSQLSDPADRAEWMAGIADWFELEPVANDDPALPEIGAGITGIWPNPFTANCTIEFETSFRGSVRLDVYNLRGQKVRSLASGVFAKGSHDLVWNGTDDFGQAVASGVYHLRLQAGDSRQIRKITIIK
ncbi:MAG: choice-of-anchor J domain-containing protein [Candidatus Cloacimonetes bacterium]|nr:choice-of-anchor J domain-containing protein [Candidatus Cloacimonadota bacterium]